LLALLVLGSLGCAQIDYIGDTLPTTNHVDVYFDQADVEYDYRVIGRIVARSPGEFYDNDKLMNKIKEEAMKHGGDAVVVIGFGHIATGSSTEHTTTTTETDKGSVVRETGSESVEEKKQVEVLVLRYKRDADEQQQ